MAEVQLVGDTILWNGYRVGRLAQTGVPSSIMADFEAFLNSAVLEPEKEGHSVKENVDIALDEVLSRATAQVPTGLLSLEELGSILGEVAKEWVESERDTVQ